MHAYRWRQLREAADIIARVPRVLVEIARPQALFNHAVLDLLERWPAVGDDLGTECDRLEQLGVATAAPPPSHRAGLSGQLVALAKGAAVPLLELGMRGMLNAQHRQNLARVAALRRREASVSAVHYQRFDQLLDAALPEILKVGSYADAYRGWVARIEPTLPVPPPSAARVTIVCEGSPSASWLAALMKQKGTWDCIFTEGPVPKDARFRLGRADQATTEFVLKVSASSELAPHALQSFAECTDVDIAYADEDFVGRVDPFFKPSFCPELAEERDLFGGAVWMRRSPTGAGVRRIPAVLSHRTTPWVFRERVRREVPADARVSIVVPFRDKPELLAQLLGSIERHPCGVPIEWVFVDNGSRQRSDLPGVTLRDDGDFNWSRLNNLGAARATGTHVLFLNNDIEAQSDGWLRVLMEYACLPDVSVVGANLWYPDGTLQHSGVVLGLKGLAGHPFTRWREGHTPFGTPLQTRQVSAVTGACMLVKRDEFAGFDETLPVSGGDVEYCLRAKGRVLNVPHVKLVHHESLSRAGRGLTEANLARERVAYAAHLPDRFYNPNLSLLFTACVPAID